MHYPWDLADPRKRPKRLAKKLAARCNWRRCPPRELKTSLAAAVAFAAAQVGSPHPYEMLFYVPTRRGARKAANMFEGSIVIGSAHKFVRNDDVGPIRLSTIFLGIDNSLCLNPVFRPDHQPVLWESMLFDNGFNPCDEDTLRDMGYGPEVVDYLGQAQWRYKSREDAVAHHEVLVEMLRSIIN